MIHMTTRKLKSFQISTMPMLLCSHFSEATFITTIILTSSLFCQQIPWQTVCGDSKMLGVICELGTYTL